MMKVVDQQFDPAIALQDLVEHPKNPRKGDDKIVAESIAANGFYGAILVQKSSRRVLAGHTRLRVARDEGAETIPGIWLDVNDVEALLILLADNRTSDLATNDTEALAKILATMLTDNGTLLGTGYDDDTYKLLLYADDDLKLPTNNTKQGPASIGPSGGYANLTDTRSIILSYNGDTYDKVVEGLTELRSTFDLETNAEVVGHLINKAKEM